MADNVGVECYTCREALSARLDGEPEGVPADQVDAHLDSCASCQEWHDSAAALTRTLRVRPATRVPDLAAAILDAAPPITPPAPRGWLPRGLLTGVAVAQLTLGVAQVVGVNASAHGGHTTGVDSSHLFNESTAWNLALGLGLLWTALRPAAVAGMLPVTAAFVAVLIPYSASDLVSGTATAARVLSHSLLLVGLVLLVFVHFSERGPSDRTPLAHNEGDTTHDASSTADRAGRQRVRRRIRLRPVSRRDAA
ncbi:zf-HC2 domain-containing protein [Lentzea sp. NBC_00516]|uniref:zf-HC2 domain-containing protein n=1 Tax=Lentzea sp. NBC_00516 TaxID=2903582 RepID=UPI002E802FA3|nr:zf-HC2 domain-containing protein [Lentzea sp. NBC_00516]WUD27935.1 zf-HC2 domain-containing protein [Lentzea sp. NBC_00516]